jgi:transposase
MASAPHSYRLFVGIDVAAKTFAMAWTNGTAPPSRAITIDQTPAGFEELRTRLAKRERERNAVLVVMEATGTYWMRLALELVQHDFAKALLKRSKTDAIDAQTLAELAARLQPERWTPPLAVHSELQQRLAHHDALILARAQFRNQRHALSHQPAIVVSVENG